MKFIQFNALNALMAEQMYFDGYCFGLGDGMFVGKCSALFVSPLFVQLAYEWAYENMAQPFL